MAKKRGTIWRVTIRNILPDKSTFDRRIAEMGMTPESAVKKVRKRYPKAEIISVIKATGR